MALIDIEVVRDGKWVSTSDVEPVPGEMCVEISDGAGYYVYRLSTYSNKIGSVMILDRDKRCTREKQFNELMKNHNLPEYFNINAMKAVFAQEEGS